MNISLELPRQLWIILGAIAVLCVITLVITYAVYDALQNHHRQITSEHISELDYYQKIANSILIWETPAHGPLLQLTLEQFYFTTKCGDHDPDYNEWYTGTSRVRGENNASIK